MKKPNLFIVGAEKSGTTFLYTYLNQHPNIYFPIIKEPQFFSKDVVPQDDYGKRLWNLPKIKWEKYSHIAFIRDLDLYLQLYENVNKKHKYLGDASVSYLYSKIAAKEIYDFNPNSKIIMILRNPIYRALSEYKMDLTIGKTTKSFSEALIENHKYIEKGLYYEQVKRYYNFFPKENIAIFIFEDLKKNPQNVFSTIFNFLDLDNIEFSEFEKKNESLSPRSKILNYILFESGLKKLISDYFPDNLKIKLKKFYYTNSTLKIEKNTEKYLYEVFKEDVNNLAQLLNLKLKDTWFKKFEKK